MGMSMLGMQTCSSWLQQQASKYAFANCAHYSLSVKPNCCIDYHKHVLLNVYAQLSDCTDSL